MREILPEKKRLPACLRAFVVEARHEPAQRAPFLLERPERRYLEQDEQNDEREASR
jgi:hypothetical protein